MLGLLIFGTLAFVVGDVVLWLRFMRPTDVIWERRRRLIAASLGVVAPLIFLFVIAQTVGLFK